MSEVADKYNKMDDSMTELHLRMKRLERGSRWGESISRRLIILVATYILACLLLAALQVKDFELSALVPAIPLVVDILVELLLRNRMQK